MQDRIGLVATVEAVLPQRVVVLMRQHGLLYQMLDLNWSSEA